MGKKTTNSVPFCPNHSVPLDIGVADKYAKKGSAPCPVSGVLFDFTQEVTDNTNAKDINGNFIQTKTFTVEDNGSGG